jgi:5-formyltetrahydrofolate cyclo-ligase
MTTESGDAAKLGILASMPAADPPAPDATRSAVAAEKARLRRAALDRRAARSADERAAAGAALARQIGDLAESLGARVVAAYLAVGTEPPTMPAIDRLRAAGVTVLLPVVAPASAGGALLWARYDGIDALRAGPFGLREPTGDPLPDGLATADLIVVPALLVDRRGVRLGRGGGYYDRALTRVAAPAYAVVHDDEVVAALPLEPHDVLVRGAVTPGGPVTCDRY